LERLDARAVETVSSVELAEAYGSTASQVRYDLSWFERPGKRGIGYNVKVLRARLVQTLGVDRDRVVYVLGGGKLGSALALYSEFRARGFVVKGIFDVDGAKVGATVGDLKIKPLSTLREASLIDRPDIGIIATPFESGQDAASALVSIGVRAILNFSGRKLVVPKDVAVDDADFAEELGILRFALTAASDA
jgi:redox-sensing transcriptional repressor